MMHSFIACQQSPDVPTHNEAVCAYPLATSTHVYVAIWSAPTSLRTAPVGPFVVRNHSCITVALPACVVSLAQRARLNPHGSGTAVHRASHHA